MMGNVKVQYNENQDQKLSKKHSNGKIDGVVAWAMARKANIDDMNEYSEGPGVFII
jgi:phage terminase large subunit-like protein